MELIILLLILLTSILFLPLEQSLLIVLLSFFVSPSLSPDYTSTLSVNIANVLRTLVIPLVFLGKIFIKLRPKLHWNWLFSLWAGFVGYVALASLWSPFLTSALKQVGYLISHTILILSLLVLLFHSEEMVFRAFSASVLLGVLMAIFYYWTGDDVKDRATIGGGAQYFGLYLATMICAFYTFKREVSRRFIINKDILAILSGLALILNKSRTGVVEVIFTLGAASIWYTIRTGKAKIKHLMVGEISIFLVLIFLLYFINFAQEQNNQLTQNRLLQPVVYTFSEDGLTKVGTFRDRLEIYQRTLSQWTQIDMFGKFFGRGTSSAVLLIAEGTLDYRDYNTMTADANRLIHNEYIRALYEWGITGFILFASISFCFYYISFKLIFSKNKTFEKFALSFAIISIFTILFSLENILASAGRPLGAALALIFAKTLYTINRTERRATQ